MRVVAVLLMVCVSGLLSACSTAPVVTADPRAPAPSDFSLEAVILVGKDVPRRTEAHLAPGRFLLFADRSLHYERAREIREARQSGYRRTLESGQVAGVWSQLAQLGLTDPANADEMINFNLVTPPTNGVVFLLAITGGGDRWVFTRSSAQSDATDPALTEVIRHLAELAWVNELTEEGTPVRARRYDLGPDPYARYREQ
jgi:hypothetical protein